MEVIQVQEVMPEKEAQKQIQHKSNENFEQKSSTHEMTTLPQTDVASTSVGITSLGLTLVIEALLVITMYKKGIRNSE